MHVPAVGRVLHATAPIWMSSGAPTTETEPVTAHTVGTWYGVVNLVVVIPPAVTFTVVLTGA